MYNVTVRSKKEQMSRIKVEMDVRNPGGICPACLCLAEEEQVVVGGSSLASGGAGQPDQTAAWWPGWGRET